MLGLVSVVWVSWRQNVNVKKKVHWSKRKLTGLLKDHICPYYDRIACIFDKNRSGVLKWFQDRPLLPCSCRVEEIGYKMQEI